MAFAISDFNGTVLPPSGTNPHGYVVDAPSGTRVDKTMVADMIVFFQRMMSAVSVTPNNTADNTPNGFQLMQAFNKNINKELAGLAEAAGAGGLVPVKMSGIVTSATPPTFTVSAGWFFYNGQFIRFAGHSYTNVIAPGDAPYVIIGAVDGLPTTTGISILADTTPDDATKFQLGNLLSFGVGAGFVASEWIDHSSLGSGWSVGSVLRYNKDAGRVYLCGEIVTTSGSPATTAFTLPVGYRPSQELRLALSSNNGSTYGTAHMIIDPAGPVNVLNIPAGSGTVIAFGATVFSIA